MEFEEALHKAGGFIKEAKGKGYFLSSVFSSIKNPAEIVSEWTLHFCGNGKSLDCYVTGNNIVVEESHSLGEAKELDTGKVKVSATEALATAGRGNKNAVTILLSLHGSPPVWTINFITAAMTVTTIDVSAETGKIIREETTSILKRV